jgi:ABC-2 type transport system permease protein
MLYLRLFREFLRACFVEEIEYRVNFIGNFLMTVLQLGLAIFMANIFFFRTNEIAGWRYEEVLMLLGVFNAIHGFIEMVLQPNMARLVQHIRKGTLDFVLLKPVDSQFYVSFRHMVFWKIIDILLGFVLIGYSFMLLGEWPTLVQIVTFALLFFAALCLVYALWMLLMTFSFWAVKVDNLSYLFMSFFDTARFPVTVYKGFLRIVLMYIFPIGFITTLPASALRGSVQWEQIMVAMFVSLIFLTLTRWLWRQALKSYTSASS